MNLLLLKPSEINNDNIALLSDYRCTHLKAIKKVQLGDCLSAGVIGGNMGTAKVLEVGDTIKVKLRLDQPTKTPTPLTLILALPRPKMLKRILQSVTSLGIKDIYLVNSAKVEKSYWQTPLLSPNKIEEQLIFGLEQGMDTLLPTIHLKKRLKPFVEDELPEICHGLARWIAHPGNHQYCPSDLDHPSILVVGPEGGLVPFELNLFKALNFTPIELGQRILRVETAIPALISRLYQL